MSRVGGRGYQDTYDDRPPPRRRPVREYQDVDVDVRESEYRRPPPEYLREDYGRHSNAGQMVVRDRNDGGYDRYDRDSNVGRSRGPPRGRGEREELDVDVREEEYTRGPSRQRRRGYEDENIDVEIRERSRQPPPREPEREILFRRGEGERRPRAREGEREEIIIRTQDDDSPPRPPPARERSRSRIDIDIREQESRDPPPRPRSRAPSRAPSRGPPAREEEEIDVKYRHEDSERTGHRDTLVVNDKRDRRRSMPPPRPVSRVEREEFVYRRQRSPSPQPPPRQTEEIVIRQRKSPSPSPSPPRAPSPPPAPPIQARPPIVQEVITHHRHIDHGVVRAPPSPSSSPSPPPRKKQEDLEIDIRRKDSRGNVYEEDIRINQDSGREKKPDREDERRITRRRSMDSSTPARHSNREETNINVNIDADFGGNTDRRVGMPQKPKELWTEVTKDLVSRDAIISMGYRFEETEEFFYVMEALRYPDVAHLVQLTDDLRYGRRERIEQIQWERQDPRLGRDSRPPPRRGYPPPDRGPNGWDEITHERDVTYESRGGRGGYR